MKTDKGNGNRPRDSNPIEEINRNRPCHRDGKQTEIGNREEIAWEQTGREGTLCKERVKTDTVKTKIAWKLAERLRTNRQWEQVKRVETETAWPRN